MCCTLLVAVRPQDVSDWPVRGHEAGGRDRDKLWLADGEGPDAVAWLWKPRLTTGDGTVARLSDVAEVVATSLGQAMGMPVATCFYAVRDGQPGVVSRNVAAPSIEVHPAVVYLSELDGFVAASADPGGPKRDIGYTLDAVLELLTGVAPPPGSPADLTSGQVFAGYLVLDAVIANTDRHPRNWALMETENGDRLLAAAFDHGSALGSGLSDENRRVTDVETFCRRGRANAFTPREGLVDLAVRAVQAVDAHHWIDRVREIDASHVAQALEAPPGRLSDRAATFMRTVVMTNRRRVLDAHGDKN